MNLSFYPDNLLQNIEYFKILQHIAKRTQLPEARKKILETLPVNNKNEIQAQFDLLLEVSDTERLRPAPFPPEALPEILRKLNSEFPVLSLEETMPTLAWLLDFREWFAKIKTLPLKILKENLNFSKEIEELLEVFSEYFTEDGKWQPEIQAKLENIQNEIYRLASRLQSILKNILRELARKGLAERVNPTIRNNRYVIPLPAQYKNYLHGILHDISNSGQTLYIEPSQTTEIQNEIRRLKFLLQQEIQKILTEFSEKIYPLTNHLQKIYELNAFIEIAKAKLKWTEETYSHIPKISETFQLKFSQARNPYLVLQKGFSETVPFDLELNPKQRILVISGPNAGGKSITLKAILLNILLFQSGIPVPVGESSEFFVFKQIFADIGDRQSAEKELSTYSARLSLMNILLKKCTKESIFFIDELGSGTAPEFGGAIAKAYLEKLLQKKCPGIITTHYEIIKNLATEHPEVLNAAMEFDTEHLTPTYRFLPAEIGRSFAFEIAERVGTHKEILQNARKYIREDTWKSEELLKEAQKKVLRLQKLLAENETLKQELKKELKKIKEKKQKLQKEKEQIIEKTKKEASKLLHSWASELKGNKNLKKVSEKIATQIRELAPSVETPSVKIQKGMKVGIQGSTVSGTVHKILGNEAEVLVGNMKFILPLSELRPANLPEKTSLIKQNRKLYTSISKEIDLRGLFVEEALRKLDKWLNNLILSNVKEAEIWHGEGSGALKKTIAQFLREHYYNYFTFKQKQGRTFLRLK